MGGEDASDCKLQIVSSTLRVRTVHVADSTKLDHVNTMTGQKALPAVYTLTRTPTHARIISRGVLNHTENDLFNGLIPPKHHIWNGAKRCLQWKLGEEPIQLPAV